MDKVTVLPPCGLYQDSGSTNEHFASLPQKALSALALEGADCTQSGHLWTLKNLRSKELMFRGEVGGLRTLSILPLAPYNHLREM